MNTPNKEEKKWDEYCTCEHYNNNGSCEHTRKIPLNPHGSSGKWEEFIKLVREGHEVVINREEVGEYELKCKQFLSQVETEAYERGKEFQRRLHTGLVSEVENAAKREVISEIIKEVSWIIVSTNWVEEPKSAFGKLNNLIISLKEKLK